jgi:hypothetical protein
VSEKGGELVVVIYIVSSEKKESIETLSRTRKEYQEFYEELRDRIARETPGVSLPQPRPEHLYKISTGIGGVHFEWSFHGRPRNSFYVELHFERGDADQNKHLLGEVATLRDEIEKETGEKVVLQEDWGPKWSRMYMAKNEGKMTEELKTWAVEKMVLLHKITEPKLDRIKAAGESGSSGSGVRLVTCGHLNPNNRPSSRPEDSKGPSKCGGIPGVLACSSRVDFMQGYP